MFFMSIEKIKDNTIELLQLFDTRQNPTKNKFE